MKIRLIVFLSVIYLSCLVVAGPLSNRNESRTKRTVKVFLTSFLNSFTNSLQRTAAASAASAPITTTASPTTVKPPVTRNNLGGNEFSFTKDNIFGFNLGFGLNKKPLFQFPIPKPPPPATTAAPPATTAAPTTTVAVTTVAPTTTKKAAESTTTESTTTGPTKLSIPLTTIGTTSMAAETTTQEITTTKPPATTTAKPETTTELPATTTESSPSSSASGQERQVQSGSKEEDDSEISQTTDANVSPTSPSDGDESSSSEFDEFKKDFWKSSPSSSWFSRGGVTSTGNDRNDGGVQEFGNKLPQSYIIKQPYRNHQHYTANQITTGCNNQNRCTSAITMGDRINTGKIMRDQQLGRPINSQQCLSPTAESKCTIRDIINSLITTVMMNINRNLIKWNIMGNDIGNN